MFDNSRSLVPSYLKRLLKTSRFSGILNSVLSITNEVIRLNNLKDYRENELKQYVVANALIFLLVHGFIDFANTENIKLVQGVVSLLGTTLLASIIYIFTILFDSVVDDKIKNRITSLYFMKLPGEYIFTEIKNKNKDIRFTTDMALQKYSHIYSAIPINLNERKKYENSQWYKIYNQYREAPMVFMSNRDYLLMRDMYVSTMVILVLYFTSCFFFKWLTYEKRFIIYLFGVLIITNVATHIKAKRFVYNVIALDISKEEEKNEYY